MAGNFLAYFAKGTSPPIPVTTTQSQERHLACAAEEEKQFFVAKQAVLELKYEIYTPIVNCGHLDQHQSFTPWETSAKRYLWVY